MKAAASPEATTHGQGGTLYGLQALRFVAAAMVVATHVLNRTVTAYPATVVPTHQFLEAGVDIFFVVSGFIMVYIVRPGTRPLAFWLQRFTRIAPLYWLATLVAFAGGFIAPRYFYGQQSWHFTLMSLLFLPTGDNMWAHPIVQQGWTLVYEFLFYSILSLCLVFRRPFVPTTVVLVLILTAGLLGRSVPWLGFYSDEALLLEFLLGMAVAALLRDAQTAPWFGVLLAVGGLVLVYLMWTSGVPYPRGLKVGLPALLVVTGTLISEPLWQRHGALQKLARLGDASYAIYIVHYFFVQAIARYLEDFPALKPVMGPIVYSGGIFVIAIGAGLVAHIYVERPLLRGVRAMLPRRRAPLELAEAKA